MTEYAVEVKGLYKDYKSYGKDRNVKHALRGIDLSIPRGVIFGILGPNGAGKSTFINILAGQTIKTSGLVKIWGFDQDVNPRQSRASIGVVPQELNCDPFFSPHESLHVQAGLYGVPRSERKIDQILQDVGLTDQAQAYVRALSGGMKRRLLLAKAMTHNPPVLILDEPTAGVDLSLRRQLWMLVRRLNEQGVTIILTTHYLEEAQEMCDQIAIINHGKVVTCQDKSSMLESLDMRQLFVKPLHSITCVPDSLGNSELFKVDIKNDDRLTFTYSRKNIAPMEIIQMVSACGIEFEDFSTKEPRLEDVFVYLTQDVV
jgi:ABC-2 type transport system ATP-binding protein